MLGDMYYCIICRQRYFAGIRSNIPKTTFVFKYRSIDWFALSVDANKTILAGGSPLGPLFFLDNLSNEKESGDGSNIVGYLQVPKNLAMWLQGL